MKNYKRIVALLVMTALVAALSAGCAQLGGGKPADTVLVIGIDAPFAEKWNPFMVETAYDHQVIDQIFAPIQMINEKNELVDYAGSCKAETQTDGTVIYTITVNKGMKFSDGKPVTIDDYIYGLYVRADSSYTGPGTLLGSDIEGINEYFYDNPNYSVDIAAMEAEAAEKYAYDKISFEDFLVYAKETSLEGWWDGDPAGDIGNGMTWSEYADASGYADELAAIDAANADQMFELITKVEYETCPDEYDSQNWYLNKMKADYAARNLEGGVTVPEISGIVKKDDYTCTVKYVKISIYGDRDLAVNHGAGNIVPKHYYGEFEKGDVTAILANMTPMGSGPYVWGGFSDNIVTCTANTGFFKAVPKTGTVRWQYVPQSDIIEKLAAGDIDIANPSSSQSNIDQMESLGLTYVFIDNAGYGYMGMNTKTIPLQVRKGIWSLMNRAPAVEAYYGDRAQVIHRPMTTVVAEYPQDAAEFYPYSTEKALEFFLAAGYTQQGGKLVDANGEQLVVDCYIGGDGKGEHPAYPMLVQAANDMAALGGEIQIQDVPFSVLTAAVDDYSADMWIMAWSAVNTCDKFAQFHTTGGQNNYQFSDPKMDSLLEQINQTIDLPERRKLVSEMLDLAVDNCLEMPIYQRKNILAYNPQTIKMDTIPTATAFYNYEQVLWKVEAIG